MGNPKKRYRRNRANEIRDVKSTKNKPSRFEPFTLQKGVTWLIVATKLCSIVEWFLEMVFS